MTDAQPPRRIRVRREPGNGRYGRDDIDRALDRGIFAHVAFADDGQPYCVPMLHARIGGEVLIHGSTASRAIRALSGGIPACLTVTSLDALVLARSVFEHTVNYESVMLLGRFQPVSGDAARLAAFAAFTGKLLPGRWEEARQPSRKELRATAILSMPIGEASVKLRSRGPDDDDSPDAALPVWAGVVPLRTSFAPPQASPGLSAGIGLPPSVRRLTGRAGAAS